MVSTVYLSSRPTRTCPGPSHTKYTALITPYDECIELLLPPIGGVLNPLLLPYNKYLPPPSNRRSIMTPPLIANQLGYGLSYIVRGRYL